jgi:hypothetical protein
MTATSPGPRTATAKDGAPESPLVEFAIAVRQDGQWVDPQSDPLWQTNWSLASPDQPSVRLLRLDGLLPARIDLQLVVKIPLLNFGGVLIPDCGRHYVNSTKALDIRSPQFQITAANAGHPFMAVNDETGNLMVAMGVLNCPGAAEIRRLLPTISKRRAMVGGDHHVALAFQWTAEADDTQELAVDLYVNHSAGHWFEALRQYTDLICERERIEHPIHPAAWEPVWCTWTAFPSSEMNEQRVLANARIARQMGMGAIILDDGWFGPGLDDDGPRPINHGDYEPDPTKFDDLPALVRRVQAMGLKFLLWHAPLCVAPTSDAAKRLSRWFMRDESGDFLSVNGMYQLCPACPQVRRHVRDETQRLLRDYGVDGLKVDLFNCLSPRPCLSAAHEHDIDDPLLALDELMATQWQAAREVNPDVLIELKQDYGNVRLARLGTMVRAGDTAYDMDTNLLRCAYTQAFAQCVHVDPLVTSIHTRPQALALMMIKALSGGVPTFSMDLVSLDDEQRQVITTWLGFYNRHRSMFQHRRRPQGRNLNVWQGGEGEQRWISAVGAACEVRLTAMPGVLHLLNGTDRPSLYTLLSEPRPVRIKWHDWRLEPVGESQMVLEPGGSMPIGPGGLAEIEFQ